jgi:hypothetical protein
MSVKIAHPISVDYELRHRGVMKKVVVKNALETAEDALHSSEMGLEKVIHVKAHLLDYVGEIRPCEVDNCSTMTIHFFRTIIDRNLLYPI